METLLYINPENPIEDDILLEIHTAGLENEKYDYDKISKSVTKVLLKDELSFCKRAIDKEFAEERPKEVNFLIISSEGKPISKSIKAISMIRIIDKKIYLDIVCSIIKGLGKDHINILIGLADTLNYKIEIDADPKLVDKYYKTFGFKETGKINNSGLVEMIYIPSKNNKNKMNIEGGRRTRKLRRKTRPTRKSRKF
jgi:hypothetical protein